MTPNITIIPAGAGSGKTYRITHDLIDWVKEGSVRPERIVAVTFTEAAAGELRARIRAALLRGNRVKDALAIERAHVSTIHALGLAIQTDHAFAAGSSPAPRHLSDAERDLLIRLELSASAPLDAVKWDLGRFGYRDAYDGMSAEDSFRDEVLKMIDLLRGLGDSALLPTLADSTIGEMRAAYGPVANDPTGLEDALVRAAQSFLRNFPQGGTPYVTDGKPKAALDDFRKEFRSIQRAANRENLRDDWKLWQGLRQLRLKIGRAEMQPDYVAHAEAIMQTADGILHHPGPLEDACRRFKALVEGAQDVLRKYETRKREAGLIDFADMVAGAETLLRNNPDIRDAVLSEVDCVIVDEFQDTNPVQFAMIWHLVSVASRAVLVGDLKQSIMAFQGADPRLIQALEQQFADRVEPQRNNWRSDPRIMDFVNAIGAGMMSADYTPLAPQRPETGETALEVLRIPCGRRSRTKSKPRQHVAARVKTLLDDKTIVIDRDSKEPRPIRPGDIAILCRSHSHAATYAETLRALAIPVRISEDGWFDSYAVQVALAALEFVANPNNTNGALCLLMLGPAAMPLEEAMRALADGTLLDHSALAPLLTLADRASWQTVDTLVPEILTLAGIGDWALQLDDPRQMRADLLRLEHEAQEFMAAHRDMRAAAGFYGQSLAVFQGWLHARKEEKDFDKRPDVGGTAADDIEIVTWHASKGREWNVVVVADLDAQVRERPGTTRARFSDYGNLGDILKGATLTHVPRLDIPEKQEMLLDLAQPEAETEAQRLMYVALTRARDRLILEWPDFALEKDDSEKIFVAGMMRDAGLKVSKGAILVNGQEFPARISNCGEEQPPEFDGPVSDVSKALAIEYGEAHSVEPGQLTPWRITPSALVTETPAELPALELVDLGLSLPKAATTELNATERGTHLHLAMRVLLGHPDRACRLAGLTGFSANMLDTLENQASAIRATLSRMGYGSLHCELPVQVRNDDGSEVNAIIDCLAEGKMGLCILDHKSGPAPDPDERFRTYWPQLSAYRDAVGIVFHDRPVRHIIINWLDEGCLSVLHLPNS